MDGNSMNPFDLLMLLAAQSASSSKPTQSGIGRLLSPDLGVLTGTLYQDPTASQQGDAYLYMQNAPDIQRAMMLPDTDVRKQIVADIVDRGMNVWDVQRNIEAYAAQQAALNPGVYAQEAETGDLKKFAQTIQSQWDNLRAAQMRSSSEMLKSNPYTQAGLPPPEMRFAPEELLPDFFSKYAYDSLARNQRLAREKSGAAARESALRFLEDQGGNQDRMGSLPIYPEASFYGSGRIAKQARRSASQEVARLQKEYKDALAQLSRVKTSYKPISKGSMSQQQAIEAAQKRVDATKSAFESRFRSAQENLGMYPAGARAGGPQDIETRRFREIAGRVAQNEDNADERLRLVQEQKVADIVAQRVAEGIAKKAEEAGYTPFMASLMRRMQFVNAGGG